MEPTTDYPEVIIPDNDSSRHNDSCFIHSSHGIIKIVTLMIWHDYGHSKINSTSQNGIDEVKLRDMHDYYNP